MTYLPAFKAQNPAISGCKLGWLSCTCFAAEMAADFDSLGAVHATGCAIRAATGDTVGGTNLAQIDTALQRWDVNLAVVYRLPWSEFAKKINAGCGAILQGGYSAIADSRYDAGRGFRGNHAIFVAPGWVGMDPLADGRAAGVYKYHGEPYPQQLLRTFAGRLNLGSSQLGDGLVYAAFTKDNVHTYRLSFLGGAFYRYFLNASKTAIVTRKPINIGTPPPAPVSAPRTYPWGSSSRILVQVLDGKYQGIWTAVPQSQLKLELVP